MKKLQIFPLALLAGALLAAPRANATLLATEPFNLTAATSFDGSGSGTGWSTGYNPWYNAGGTGTRLVTSASLNYPSTIISTTSGNAGAITTTGEYYLRTGRNLDTPAHLLANAAGIRYISFLYSTTHLSRYAQFGMGQDGGTTAVTFGTDGGQFTMELSGATKQFFGAPVVGNTYLIVGKYVSNGAGNATVSMNAYAVGDSVPATEGSWAATVSGAAFNLDRVFGFQGNDLTMTIDEIRIGTTYTDVVAARDSLAWDNFPYTNGFVMYPVVGYWPPVANGGAGWAWGWYGAQGGGTVTETGAAPGLTYPPGVIYTGSSNRMEVVCTDNYGKINRELGGSGPLMAGVAGIRYVSFLVQYETTLNNYTQFGLVNKGNFNGITAGATGGEFVLAFNNEPLQHSGFAPSLNTTYLWIIKLVSDGTTMSASASWYGPTDTVPTTEPVWMLTTPSISAYTIDQVGGTSGFSTYSIDEVVVADSYPKVIGVPYIPTTTQAARTIKPEPAVTFSTDLNHNYTVQGATSGAGPWTSLQNVPGDGNAHTYILPVGLPYSVLQVLSRN